MEDVDHPLPRMCVKVDEDVAAENGIGAPHQVDLFLVEEIQLSKLAHCADLIVDLGTFRARREVLLRHSRGRRAKGSGGVNSPPRCGDAAFGEVGTVDPKVPSVEETRLVNEDRKGIDLFPGRAARAPYRK